MAFCGPQKGTKGYHLEVVSGAELLNSPVHTQGDDVLLSRKFKGFSKGSIFTRLSDLAVCGDAANQNPSVLEDCKILGVNPLILEDYYY